MSRQPRPAPSVEEAGLAPAFAPALGERGARLVERALFHPAGDMGKGDRLAAGVAPGADHGGEVVPRARAEAAADDGAAMRAEQLAYAHGSPSPDSVSSHRYWSTDSRRNRVGGMICRARGRERSRIVMARLSAAAAGPR